MEGQIKAPKRWTEKFFECRDLNKELGIDPTVLTKGGLWEKPDHNELNKEFQRQLKGKKNA